MKPVPYAGDQVDAPLAGLREDQLAVFFRGDELFGTSFRESDGLGPLYIRSACTACHEKALRGPGSVEKFVFVKDDGVTPEEDQTALLYGHSTRPLVADGAHTPINVAGVDAGASDGGAGLRVSVRVGPPLLALGYIEAVAESEILRVAAEQCARGDGVCGTYYRVKYESTQSADPQFHDSKAGSQVLGRFGVKGRIGFIDDFVADALVSDMGLTSPLRPKELTNPDGIEDDKKPGVDVSLDTVRTLTTYLRTIAIPRRVNLTLKGSDAFARAGCATCHVPSMKTRADYPIAALAGIEAPIFTDVLLHDMGLALADGMVDGPPRRFRTAPLVGVRFQRSYLHDGRAKTVEEAIAAHDAEGSEAREAARAFLAMGIEDRIALLTYLRGL